MNDLEGVENAHKFLLIEAEGIAKEKDLHGGEDITCGFRGNQILGGNSPKRRLVS